MNIIAAPTFFPVIFPVTRETDVANADARQDQSVMTHRLSGSRRRPLATTGRESLLAPHSYIKFLQGWRRPQA
jgi:hypothetical protein